MKWDDLHYVLAIARAGTLSGAADALGVTQPTAGRRLRGLEDALGVRLFDRTPDGFVATAAGEELIESAARVETEVLAVEGRVLGRDSTLRGGLRVGTMDVLAVEWEPHFTSFRARYPAVELTLLASDEALSLTRREADVVLRMSNAPPDYLVGRRVGRLDFAVYGAVDLVDRIGADAPLGAFPWLHWDPRAEMSRWLDGWLAEHAPGAVIAMRVDFGSLLIQETVARGVGVHFLATRVGDRDPRVRRIGGLVEGASRDVWLLTLAELRTNARVRALMDHLGEVAAG